MRDAAVGHQCVECVREGNKSVRAARTVFGGRVARTPAVTYTLIAINVAMYLLQLARNEIVTDLAMLGVATDRLGYVVPGYGVADGEWYRLISGAFLHSLPSGGSLGISHILFNMWALWVIGQQLELALGRARFITLYLLSALGGSVLVYLLAPEAWTVGASGAIFGLFGGFFVVLRRLRQSAGGIVFLLAINLVITFAVPNISWQGHLGGLIVGGVVAWAYAYAPAARRTAVHVGASVGVLVLLIALVVLKTAQLTGSTAL